MAIGMRLHAAPEHEKCWFVKLNLSTPGQLLPMAIPCAPAGQRGRGLGSLGCKEHEPLAGFPAFVLRAPCFAISNHAWRTLDRKCGKDTHADKENIPVLVYLPVYPPRKGRLTWPHNPCPKPQLANLTARPHHLAIFALVDLHACLEEGRPRRVHSALCCYRSRSSLERTRASRG